MIITILFVSMLLLIMIGMDAGIAMGMSELGDILTTQDALRALPFTLIPQQLLTGAGSFSLVAVPLFILAGEIMSHGGITQKLVSFAKVGVGHFRGGLGHTCVVVNMIMAGMSGSAVADATATGAILIPIMKKDKYNSGFAGAIVAAASTIGPVIPPSIPMILIGSMVGISVGRLFIGGAVPGVLMGIMLMVIVGIMAKKKSIPVQPKSTLREYFVSLKSAILPLGLPVLILGSIVTGITTPTEAAVLGVWYALFLSLFIYKSFRIKDLPDIILRTCVGIGAVLLTCACGTLFGWVVTSLQMGPKLLNLLFAITSNPVIILLIINIILLILGMVMATIPIILLMTPILFPIIIQLGIDPIHFGVMMCLNLMIGLLTPPIGLHLFIASSIAEVSIVDIIKDVWPMIVMLLIVLGLVTYFPQITLWLPNLLLG